MFVLIFLCSQRAGAGEELQAHLKKHIDQDCETKIACRWGGPKGCVAAKAAIDTKVKLVRHLEAVHGRLRLRCETCGKTRALNKKKEIVNCDHAAQPKRARNSRKKARKGEAQDNGGDDDEEEGDE
jgi:hypothetical protein